MREIKFRAWDGENMHNVISMMPGELAVTIFCQRFPFTQTIIAENIMQFTGLKDKNGKEIYEGDIKRWQFNQDDRLYVCYWSDIDCGFRWRLIKHNQKQPAYVDIPFDREEDYYNYVIKTNQRDLGIDKWSEVIGNIYENPELLK